MTSLASFRPTRLGILGGGQLACMLGEAALPLGIQPCFLTEDPQAPALKLFPEARLAGKDLEADLTGFFAKTGTVIFENEFVDVPQLRRAARGMPVEFLPSLEAIEIVQDKLGQKRLLERIGVPTAPYEILRTDGDLVGALGSPFARFPSGFVLKWSRMGYDGKGVLVVHPGDQSGPALERIRRFVADGLARGGKIYAEQKVAFRRELAIIGVHAQNGEFRSYPLVVSEQERGICKKVTGPATALGIPAEREREAADFALKVAESLHLVGCFALEFFEAPDGSLLVNEIAPRVHNTGHYTQDACATSQFENHLRAVLGLPLGSTRSLAPAFAMLNLLGPEGVVASSSEIDLPSPLEATHLHWYCKAEVRPWRKLGHLNGLAEAPEKLPMVLRTLESCEKEWHSLLAKQKETNR